MSPTVNMAVALVVVLFCIFLVIFRSNEVARYRELVPKPENLLYESAGFVFIERPNDQTSHVELFGKKFTEKSILRAVKKDVIKLEKRGYKTQTEYFFDVREPLSEEDFAKEMETYRKDFAKWQEKDYRTRDVDPKPKAPYDFSKTTILSNGPEYHHTFEW